MDAQVADVSTPLASVYQMCRSGNKVIFTEEGGTIINKRTGQKIPIDQRNGAYEFNMWVPANKDKDKDHKEKEQNEVIANDSEDQANMDMNFIRQG